MMLIEFEKDYLRELYEDGKTKNKKYRFQKEIINRYVKAINALKAANRIEDLFLFKSLNYEKLTGNKKGVESIRVNDQFRIEFRSRIEGEEPDYIIICAIIELSNHYK
jgi:proteic killer suppression protein